MEARWGDVRKPWQAHRLDAVMRCKPLPSLSCALQAGVSGLCGLRGLHWHAIKARP